MTELRRYTVRYYERLAAWVDVWAANPAEAVEKARDGEIIEGTQDSDPGKLEWKRARAVLKEELTQ